MESSQGEWPREWRTGIVMGERTARQRVRERGVELPGSAPGKCHSAGGGEGREGRSAGTPGRADDHCHSSFEAQQLNAARPVVPARRPPGPRRWEAASQKPRAGGGFTFAGGWRRSSPSSARRRLHVLSGMRRRRPRPLSLSLSPPGPVAAGSCAAAPTPPLLPLPLRGSLWTPPSSTRLRALNTNARA